jgi:hypothetical protein
LWNHYQRFLIFDFWFLMHTLKTLLYQNFSMTFLVNFSAKHFHTKRTNLLNRSENQIYCHLHLKGFLKFVFIIDLKRDLARDRVWFMITISMSRVLNFLFS